MDNSIHKKEKQKIYKNANQLSILDYKKENLSINRALTATNKKHLKFQARNEIYSPNASPRIKANLKPISFFPEKNGKNISDYSNKMKSKVDSPHFQNNLNSEYFSTYMSPVHSYKTPNISPDQNVQNEINNKKSEHEINVKMIFYFLMSMIYFSLNLLCIKILFNFSMPEIPPLGTSLFIISFNNAILSIIFIIIDQINYIEFLYFKLIIDNFPTMVINFFAILLTIKILEKMNLIIFIILINMKPIISSYIKLRNSNKTFKPIDTFCYILFSMICLIELFIENKISIICTFLLITLNLIRVTKLKPYKNLHSYITIFGTSLIGVCISPIIMVIKRDILIISFSQYLLFLIISLTYFFNIYFLSKYSHYSFGHKFKIFGLIFTYFLFIIFSNLILRENTHPYIHIFLLFSFFINIYAFLRNDSINL